MTSTVEFSSDTERGEHVSLRTPRGDSSEAFRSLRNALLLLSHILILSVFATITSLLPMVSKAFSASNHKLSPLSLTRTLAPVSMRFQ